MGGGRDTRKVGGRKVEKEDGGREGGRKVEKEGGRDGGKERSR